MGFEEKKRICKIECGKEIREICEYEMNKRKSNKNREIKKKEMKKEE